MIFRIKWNIGVQRVAHTSILGPSDVKRALRVWSVGRVGGAGSGPSAVQPRGLG